MSKTQASISLIYGKNCSGKSKMVRETIKEKGGYLFFFDKGTPCKDLVDKTSVMSLFQMLTGRELNENVQPSFSEVVVTEFCYQLQAIFEMEEPFKDLFLDDLPCSLDKATLLNLFALFNYLKDRGFNITFTTCIDSIYELATEFFKGNSDFNLIKL